MALTITNSQNALNKVSRIIDTVTKQTDLLFISFFLFTYFELLKDKEEKQNEKKRNITITVTIILVILLVIAVALGLGLIFGLPSINTTRTVKRL